MKTLNISLLLLGHRQSHLEEVKVLLLLLPCLPLRQGRKVLRTNEILKNNLNKYNHYILK